MSQNKKKKEADDKYKKEYKKMTGKSVKSAKKYYGTKVSTTSVGVGKVRAPKKKNAKTALAMVGLAAGGRAARAAKNPIGRATVMAKAGSATRSAQRQVKKIRKPKNLKQYEKSWKKFYKAEQKYNDNVSKYYHKYKGK